MSHHQYYRYDPKGNFSLFGWIFLIAAIVALAGLGVYFFSTGVKPSGTNTTDTISSGNTNEIAENINEAENVNASANENANANLSNENQNTNAPPLPDSLQSNIMVRFPEDGATIGLPIKIQGEARVFESVVNYRVKTVSGTVLEEGSAVANAPDAGQFGQYLVSLSSNITAKTSAVVEVFAISAKDGKEVDKITRSVTIDPDLRSLEIYFNNSKAEPEAICNVVIPAFRSIDKVEKIGTAALNELLKGPTDEEKAAGFFTSIPSGTKLQELTIEGTQGRPDFTKELDYLVDGTCRAAGIHAQIEKTLLQFPTIQSVRISIEGKTDGILQP